jgi:hypothetical protein
MSTLREGQSASLIMTRALLHDLVMSNEVPMEFSGRAFKCIKNFPPLDPFGDPIWAPHSAEAGPGDWEAKPETDHEVGLGG